MAVVKRSIVMLAAAQTLGSSAAFAAAAPSTATITVPGFGAVTLAKGSLEGQTVLPLGALGPVVFTGAYQTTGKFELCGQASASWSPFSTANLGLPKLTALKIANPKLCVRRTAAKAPIELSFDGDVSAGGSGLHLNGTLVDDLKGPQFTAIGTALGDWNLKDVHKSLDKNTITQQLALSDIRFVVTSQRVKDPLWGELAAGFHVMGAVSLTPEARKASDLARVLGAASALAGAGESTKVPLHGVVTSSRLAFSAGIPGKLRLKPPFAMAGNATWEFALTSTTLEAGAKLPISYKFASQKTPVTFVGEIKFKTPQTFAGALSASGEVKFGRVTLNHITMQVGLDAVTFPATGLPSSVGLRAQAQWAGATWELAGVAGTDPSALLLNASITDASLDSILAKFPLSPKFKAAVPDIIKKLVVRKAELYFVPVALTLGERAYAKGMSFTGDVDGPMGCRAAVSVGWEDKSVRAKVLWEGFKSEAIAKEIDQLLPNNTLGLTPEQAKAFLADFGLDTLVISVTQGTGGVPTTSGSWRARFRGKFYNGDFSVTASSITEVARGALSQMAKAWLDKKTRKLL
jgi:hypothetical protein